MKLSQDRILTTHVGSLPRSAAVVDPWTRMMGKQTFKRAACVAPIALVDRAAGAKDIANLRTATAAHRPVEAFMNAASPGVVSAFQSNKHYPSHDAAIAYKKLGALAEGAALATASL